MILCVYDRILSHFDLALSVILYISKIHLILLHLYLVWLSCLLGVIITTTIGKIDFFFLCKKKSYPSLGD